MQFDTLRKEIHSSANKFDFEKACSFWEKQIFALSKADLIPLITEVGVIPEDISHDSSEEKLYAKIADIYIANIAILLILRLL